MMERTGSEVEPNFISDGGQNIKSAIVACLGCKHEDECKSWLEMNDGKTRAPGFCANSDRLNTLYER